MSSLARAPARGEPADLVIMPDIAHASFSDFSQVQDIYDAGVRAAEEALPDLRRILGLAATTSTPTH